MAGGPAAATASPPLPPPYFAPGDPLFQHQLNRFRISIAGNRKITPGGRAMGHQISTNRRQADHLDYSAAARERRRTWRRPIIAIKAMPPPSKNAHPASQEPAVTGSRLKVEV